MRNEEDIKRKAANLKVVLINRGYKMEQLISNMAKSKAGMVRRINHERLETMQVELDFASAKQGRDAQQYATLGWVLGITDDIEADNLELEK